MSVPVVRVDAIPIPVHIRRHRKIAMQTRLQVVNIRRAARVIIHKVVAQHVRVTTVRACPDRGKHFRVVLKLAIYLKQFFLLQF